jgi:epoxyqueuosine reductase
MLETIIREIKSFALSEANCSSYNQREFFSTPIVGFADVKDPLFSEYKTIIGSFHLTPVELFEHEFGLGSMVEGTVISWILPITADTICSNQKQKQFPSNEWAYTRFYGEQFIDRLREHVFKVLKDSGFRSAIPPFSSKWQRLHDQRVGWTATWSERHAAYAAGLGTFSLTDGLITAKGIAHRCGSIITDLVLEPSIRVYSGPYDYCLHYRDKTCGICIDRCPADAISENGHDKDLCHAYQETQIRGKERYGLKPAGCGLCQTGVPCERKIP